MDNKEELGGVGVTMKENPDNEEVIEEVVDQAVEEAELEDVETEVVVSEIDQLKTQLQEEESKYLRLLADYDNFKRRATLDKEALQKYRAQSLLTSLIPVVDNFSRAISVEAKTDEARSMMEGMDMIYRTLVESLKSEGLVEIESLDQEFDPNFHQAIMTDTDPDKSSGIVLEELQKGYILKDRVLRPSMVKVNE